MTPEQTAAFQEGLRALVGHFVKAMTPGTEEHYHHHVVRPWAEKFGRDLEVAIRAIVRDEIQRAKEGA